METRLRLLSVPSPAASSSSAKGALLSSVLLEPNLSGSLNRSLMALHKQAPDISVAAMLVRERGNGFVTVARYSNNELVIDGQSSVPETTLTTFFPGSTEDWIAGKSVSETSLTILDFIFSQSQLSVDKTPTSMLWMPVHIGGVNEGLVLLGGQSDLSAQGGLDDLIKTVWPVIRDRFAKEGFQRQVEWLNVTNSIFQTSPQQPLSITLTDALDEAIHLSGADGARLVLLEGGKAKTLEKVGWGGALAIEKSLDSRTQLRILDGEQVSIARYDLYPAKNKSLVDEGLSSVFALATHENEFDRLGLLLFSVQRQWIPSTQTALHLSELLEAMSVLRAERILRDELSWAAFTDSLTGLGNRRSFERELQEIQASPGRIMALVLFDLDSFKSINDTYGHVHADHVLVRLGGLLRSRARAGDKAYRLGGDEFALLLNGSSGLDVSKVVERYRGIIQSVKISDKDMLECSVGFAIFPNEGFEFEQLWHLADNRLYDDKENRKQTLNKKTASQFEARNPLRLRQTALDIAGQIGLEKEEIELLADYFEISSVFQGFISSGPAFWTGERLLKASKLALSVQRFEANPNLGITPEVDSQSRIETLLSLLIWFEDNDSPRDNSYGVRFGNIGVKNELENQLSSFQQRVLECLSGSSKGNESVA